MTKRVVILVLCFFVALFSFPILTACGGNDKDDNDKDDEDIVENLPEQLTHNHEHLHIDDVCEKCGWQVLLIDDSGNVYMVKDGNISAEYYCEKVTEYGLTNPLISIYISDKVKSISEKAFQNNRSIKTIIMDNGLKSIGDDAFDDCRNLTSVTISNKTISIGSCAFSNCTSLKNITIPDSVTTISSCVFSGCNSLTSITIGKSVTRIGVEAFKGCSSLRKVTYTGTIDHWCEIKFVSDDIKPFNKYYLNAANPLFYAHNLYINDDLITHANITTVEIQPLAFFNCTSLTSVTINDSVTSIGHYAFDGCSSLKSITIPDSVTSIGVAAFDYRLASVTFETTNGWYCIDERNQTTKIASNDLANKETAAKFLSSTYSSTIWNRT